MHPILKWSLALAGLVLALDVIVPGAVWLESETVIEQRYPLPSTILVTRPETVSVARGRHLVVIAGCADCHGAGLEGRLLGRGTPLPVWSSNLRRHELAADEFERAMRDGLTPAATSEWGMPAADYTYLSADDLAALWSYLQSLAEVGPERPRPRFDMRARFAILRGDLVPSAERALESPASLDLGPRYDGGRYLARIACSECHGTDLAGAAAAPDLTAIERYDRGAFFALLRAGRGAGGRPVPVMAVLARTRFAAFHDYEINALYDYLSARAQVLAPRHDGR